MKKSTKTFTGSVAALASVASIIAPAATVFAAEKTAVEVAVDAVAYAEKTVNFFDWNLAFGKVVALGDKNPQYFELLGRLSKIEATVKTDDVKAVLTAMDELAANKDLTNFYNIYELANKVGSDNNKNYLLNELNDWGKKAVFTPEVVAATDAVLKAWTDKTPESIAAAKAAAAKLTVAGNLDWVNAQIAQVEELVALNVNGASVVKANQIKVAFNKAVEDTTKATFTVKRGSISVNVKSATWNADKTEVVLEGFANYIAGDYTVAVAGLGIETGKEVAAVKVEAQKVAGIEVLGDAAVLTGVVGTATTATVNYKVVDQYGTDVTTSLGGSLAASTTATGDNALTPAVNEAITLNAATKNITLTWAAAPAKDSLVVVTLADSATGVVGTKTLKVATQSAASDITLGELKNVDNKVLRTSTVVGTDIFQFDVNAVDQYGNKVDTATQLGNDYLVLPSDAALTTTWVNATSTAPAKLKLTGIPATAGTYSLTIVSKTTGKSVVATVVVEKAIAVDTLTLSTPSDLYILNESVYIPFTAVDQYGNTLTKFSDLTGKVVLSTQDNGKYPVALEKNPVDGTARIKLSTGTNALGQSAAANDNVVVTSVANGKSSTVTVKLNAAKVPTRIAALSTDVAKKLVVGATSSIAYDQLTIKDQYERTMTLPASGYKVVLTTSDAAKVNVTTTDITTAADGVFAGVAAGTANITATIWNTTTGAAVANSSLEFVSQTVDKKDLVNYEIDTTDKVFVNAHAYTTPATTEEQAYEVAATVYGLTAANERVALDQTQGGTDLVRLSSTNAKVDAAELATGNVYASGTLASGVHEESATIVAVVKGYNDVITTVTKTITLTDAAKVGGAVAVKAISGDYVTFADGVAVMKIAKVEAMNTKSVIGEVSNTTKASVYFEVKDQFGVASAAVKPSYYTISVKDVAGKAQGASGYAGGTYGINNTTGVVSVTTGTPVVGDEITITAVTADGKLATVKVIVVAN